MEKNPAAQRPFHLQVQYILNTTGASLSLIVLLSGVLSLLGIHAYSLEIVRTVQCLYGIEVAGALFKITPQSLPASLMQIASRVFVSVFVCTDAHPAVTAVMFAAWGLSDTLRFLYYLCPAMKRVRYLASFVLYPLGVLCEVYLMVCRRSLICAISILVYIPGFKYLYGRIKNRVSCCR